MDEDFQTILVLSGIGVPDYSARGVTQTLEPIAGAAQQRRDINGTLHDLSDPLFQKYRTTISCTDQAPPACDGVWPGQVVTIDCVSELCYNSSVSGGTPQRSVVSGSSRTVGSFTFYRPQLSMQVTNFSTQTDEYGATCAWSIDAEEV